MCWSNHQSVIIPVTSAKKSAASYGDFVYSIVNHWHNVFWPKPPKHHLALEIYMLWISIWANIKNCCELRSKKVKENVCVVFAIAAKNSNWIFAMWDFAYEKSSQIRPQTFGRLYTCWLGQILRHILISLAAVLAKIHCVILLSFFLKRQQFCTHIDNS